MNPRERLIATINHQTPDRLCVDLGAGAQTGMGVLAVHNLRQRIISDPGFRVKVIEPYQMLGEFDPEMIRVLQLDVAGISTPGTMFGFRSEGWKPYRMNQGTEVLVPDKFNYTMDETGAVYMYPEGDTSVPPCAKMPGESYFFDALPRQHPVDDSTLNPDDNLEEFAVLSSDDLLYYEQTSKKLYEETELGIYATLPGMAFGDIALVPATWLKDPGGIRDVTEWYISLLTRQDLIHKIFEKQCEIALKNIELLADAIGDRVQVVFLSGTDFGTQTGLFNSAESYRELFKPHQKALNDRIHELTNWKTFIHCCGAILELIPDFIEAGWDILNPVQISATGMDPEHLKKEFGRDIVFWGGGIDTQKTLPFGTRAEIKKEVRRNIRIFSENGGYVFNPVHNVQSNVPLENIIAMLEAVNDCRAVDSSVLH